MSQHEQNFELETVDRYFRPGGSGGLELVPWREQIYPYNLFFDEQFVDPLTGLSVGPLPNGVTTMYRNRGWSLSNLDRSDLASPCMFDQLVFENSSGVPAEFTVMMKDMGDQTQFMNQPIHIQDLAGSGQLAGLMCEGMWLPTNHAIRTTFTQVAGATNVMRMNLAGKMLFPWAPALDQYPEDRAILQGVINKHNERRKYIYPFWLTSEKPVSLAAGGQFEVDALVGDDGHFEGHFLVGHSTGSYLINVLNPDTKQSYTNATAANSVNGIGGGIDNRAAVGTAQNPQELPVPWLIPAGKRLRFQFTDTSAAPNQIFFAIRGVKYRSPIMSIDELRKKYAIPDSMKLTKTYA